jgi:hypothetical protein
MVPTVSEGLDSSEEEGLVVKRRSTRQKIMVDSDNEADTDTGIRKLCTSISGPEPDTEPSRNDLRGDSRDLAERTHGQVDSSKEKKKWKILHDSDCSLDEETSSSLLTVAKNSKDSDDGESPRHSMGHGPLSHFSLKESDLYDADGSEDEAVPKHKSTGRAKLKGRCLSQRKTKVSRPVTACIQYLWPQIDCFLVTIIINIIRSRVYTF